MGGEDTCAPPAPSVPWLEEGETGLEGGGCTQIRFDTTAGTERMGKDRKKTARGSAEA